MGTIDILYRHKEQEINTKKGKVKNMTRKVEFIWWKSRKVWNISGKDINDITKKADILCNKYHAVHFQILD